MTAKNTVASDAVELLKKNKLTISAAESCTGGLFAKCITDCSGASAVLNESYVTYSPEAKMRILGVNKVTIDKYSVVSKEVAEEMAEGVRRISSADIGVSFTGYAGPDGENVGLVYSAISCSNGTYDIKMNLKGSRDDVRNAAVNTVFAEIIKLIKQESTV